MTVPTEDQEQEAFFEWIRYQEHTYPGINLAFHVPNGGSRNVVEAAKFKRIGVKAGVPDIIIPVAKGKYHGMYIEMKRTKNGRLSEAQANWMQALNQQGYYAVMAKGCKEAIEFVRKYWRM